MTKDYFGRELSAGDIIAYSVDRGRMEHGVIYDIVINPPARYRQEPKSIKVIRMETDYGTWNNDRRAYDPPENPWKACKVTCHHPDRMVRVSIEELKDHDKPWCQQLLILSRRINAGEKI